MMKQIIPIVLVLTAVGGAGFAAKMLRGGPPTAESYADDNRHGGDEGGVKKIHDDESHGSDSLGYFKFGRDFVIPVMRGSTVDSIVLMRLTIELDQDKVEIFRPKEPRIRDEFMQTLLSLSHDGLFSDDITAPMVYQTIQDRLMEAAAKVMNDEPTAVLIVDFARQDQ